MLIFEVIIENFADSLDLFDSSLKFISFDDSMTKSCSENRHQSNPDFVLGKSNPFINFSCLERRLSKKAWSWSLSGEILGNWSTLPDHIAWSKPNNWELFGKVLGLPFFLFASILCLFALKFFLTLLFSCLFLLSFDGISLGLKSGFLLEKSLLLLSNLTQLCV